MVNVPTAATLKKYGLSLPEWELIGSAQGWVCAICRKTPPSGRLVIDHEHAKGWKKMQPEARKRFVRGLLCWTCNHYIMGRGSTIERHRNAVTYLTNYATRNK